jgi:hypothetical protein
MGEHIDTRNRKKPKLKEHDELARRRRATFKQYLAQIDEDLLEADLSSNLDTLPEGDQDD